MTLRRHIITLLCAVVFVLSAAGCSRAPSGSTFSERFEVGPDQQALIASMVGHGVTLPGGCVHTTTSLERTHFQARYTCPGVTESPTIEFRHREVAPRGCVVTAQFALIPFGARGVPPALLTTITERVRAQESAWRWVPYRSNGPPISRGPPRPSQPPVTAPPPPAAHDASPPAIAPPAPPPAALPSPPDASAPRSDATASQDVGRVVATPSPPVAPPPPVAAPSPPVVPSPSVAAPSPPLPSPPVAVLGSPVSAPATPLGERSPNRLTLGGLLADGVVLFLAGLIFIAVVTRRQLRDTPAWVGPALAAIVVAGAALRLAMSPVAPLNAWSYARIIPLARHTYEGVVLPNLSQATGATFYLTAVNFTAGFLVSALTPLVLFAHARYVLKDHVSALAAAAILAVLPMHLRFSHSDVEILQTLLTSSLTFVVLYGALTDDSPRWRAACFAALAPLCVATYYSRPEAIIFFPLDLGGIVIAWSSTPRARRALAAGVISAAGVFSIVTHLLVSYRHNLDDGLSLRTLQTALRTLFSPRFNMLISPWSTPPGLLLAAALGGLYLWRRGERARSAFLVTWLLAFFVVHSYVIPWAPAMQARYHLNLVTPFVLLAAALTPALARAPRWAMALAAVYLAASPLLHRAFIRDVDYFEMREYAFLESVRDRIPDRCTVLEFQPMLSVSSPTHLHASRLNRIGTRVRAGQSRWSWDVVSMGAVDPAAHPGEPRETLSPAAREVIAHPPPCLMAYLGLMCRSHRLLSAPTAPVCDELRASVDLERVAVTRFRSRIYDPVSVGRIVLGPTGRTETQRALREGDEVELGLYRIRPRR